MLRPAKPFESRTPGLGVALDEGDRDPIESELAELLDRSRRRFATGPQLGVLHDRMAEFVLRGGKRLRPRLCLTSYRIMSGESGPLPAPVVRAAASLELFHAFMLVHDDLIDRSVIRRDRPTLHEAIRLETELHVDVTGAADLGLLGGDLLFALGMRMLGHSGLPDAMVVKAHRIVTDMLIDTGLGEALDVLYDQRSLESLEEGEILEAYIRKTSRYSVSAPLVLGATLAGCARRECRVLGDFGDRLGFAYQILNDLDGLVDDPEHVCPDLDSGKRTLLLWTTYRRLDPVGRRELDAGLLSPVGVERRTLLLELIRRSGAMGASRARLRDICRDARQILRDSSLSAPQRYAFGRLLSWFGSSTRPLARSETHADVLPIHSALAPGVHA